MFIVLTRIGFIHASETLFKNILAAENAFAKVEFIANKGVDKGCILCQRII